jgi:hypothetical protein
LRVAELEGGAMRTRFVSVVGLVCLLGLIGGTVVANAGADITSPETFTLVGTTIKDRFVDVGKHGFSPGDVNMFVERLTDETDAVVGKARIQCTSHVGPWAICIGTFNITGRGEIVGEGIVPFGPDATSFDVPVTGGTGDFSNVRGEVNVVPTATGEVDTFDLIP